MVLDKPEIPERLFPPYHHVQGPHRDPFVPAVQFVDPIPALRSRFICVTCYGSLPCLSNAVTKTSP
jgi:hypothetical protein